MSSLREIFHEDELEFIHDCIERRRSFFVGRLKKLDGQPEGDNPGKNQDNIKRCEDNIAYCDEVLSKWAEEML